MPPSRAGPGSSRALAVALASTLLWWRTERRSKPHYPVAQLRCRARLARAVPVAAAPPAASTGPRRPRRPPSRSARWCPMAPMPSAARAWRSSASSCTGSPRQGARGMVEIRTYRGPLLPVGQWQRWLLPGAGGAALRALRRSGQPRRRGAARYGASPLALANLIGDIRSVSHGAVSVRSARAILRASPCRTRPFPGA